MKLTLVLAVLSALAAPSAFAQGDPDGPVSKTRLRLGPLTVSPTIALTNAGIDSNVFNTNRPQSDFTMTVTPKADLSARFGRTRLTGAVKQDLVYFRKFASERSANTSYRALATLPLTRVTLSAGTEYLNIRDRPGFEIDARSQRSESGQTGMAEVRAFGKTFVSLSLLRSTVRFDRDAAFLGSSLALELNRTMTSGGIAVRYNVTPVTSLVFKADRQQDRFESSSLRNSNSLRVMGGVQFDPLGVISGSASFGYRHFETFSGGIPGYSGAMASVDVSYRASGSMKLGLRAVRDLQYSYDINQPYYVQTGAEGSFERQIRGPFDLVGRLGAQHLGYRGRLGATASLSDRVDTIHSIGGGIGYRIGGAMRIGLNLDKQHRASDLSGHGYNGLRYGTSVTYGF